jgi:hypothetical protein
VGYEREKMTKRGSSSAGRSPYSCTRQWLGRQKQWAVNTVGGEAAAAVSWAPARQRRPLSDEVGAVRTQSARGSDRAVDGRAPTVSLLSLNYPNQFKLGN